MTGAIRAEVKPADGKHYGTDVLVHHPSGRTFSINVWLPIGAPSDDELAQWGTDRAGWDANVEVDDGWGDKAPIRSLDLTCDGHYESSFEVLVAKAIATALDGLVAE